MQDSTGNVVVSPSSGLDVVLEHVDLSDVSLFEDGPPYALFARLREHAPVHWSRRPNGSGFWSVTRAEDIARISRDHATFSTEVGGVWIDRDTPAPVEILRDMILVKDEPAHSQYRAIVNEAFLPRAVACLDRDIRAVVARVVDRICAAGQADLVADIAVPVPLIMISAMLGVPESDVPQLLHWTDEIERKIAAYADATATLVEISEYLAAFVTRERQLPGDSLVHALANAQIHGRYISDGEIAFNFASLLFGGNDTTRNAFSVGMLALLDHPDQLDLLRKEPELIPRAVEEFLRWSTPLGHFARTATADVTVHGTRISAGDRIVLWYSSASRDPAAVPHPDHFDVTRTRAAHQAFGAGGPHFCPGAQLARAELAVMLEETLARLPDLRATAAPTRVLSTWVNGLASLPIAFSPTPPRG